MSSLGANLDETSGNLAYAEMELAFDKLDADVLSLRPGYFMENLLTDPSAADSKTVQFFI